MLSFIKMMVFLFNIFASGMLILLCGTYLKDTHNLTDIISMHETSIDNALLAIAFAWIVLSFMASFDDVMEFDDD